MKKLNFDLTKFDLLTPTTLRRLLLFYDYVVANLIKTNMEKEYKNKNTVVLGELFMVFKLF